MSESAKRLRSFYAGGTPYDDREYMQVNEDAHSVAAMWLAEHPADDDTPVDDVFLAANGFYESAAYGGDGGVWLIDFANSIDDSLCFNLNTMRSEIWIGSRYVTIPGGTRGDLRRLMAALKIEVGR